jgi:hypothetical protein
LDERGRELFGSATEEPIWFVLENLQEDLKLGNGRWLYQW